MKPKASGALVRRTLWHYFQVAKRYKWLLLINFFVPIAAVAVGDIAFRYFLAKLFGQLANYNEIPMEAIWHTFYLLMVLVGSQIVLWRINDYTLLWRQAKTLRDMEQYLFERLQNHSYRFYSDNFAGSLTTQFNRFLHSYEQLEFIFTFELLIAASTLTLSICVLLFIAPSLGIALLIWAVLFITLMTWLAIKKSPITREASAADSQVTANTADVITNVVNVKVFARKLFETKRFGKTSQYRFEKRWRSYKYDAHIRNIRWVFVVVFLFLFIYLSIKLVTSGQVSMAEVLAAQLFIMMIYYQLFNLNQTIQRIELAFADASEMTEILDLPIEVKDPINPEKIRIQDGLIEFHNVDFHYADDDNSVLTGFALTILPGQKVGLVGHSGSGKSTLTRLLMRFVDIQGGYITIDGQNIADITQDDLRSNIAFVPQEPILFHRSIKENIQYGREGATDNEVRQAAKLAQAHEFIQTLPHGYDTLVGERGIKLSGGEKQRVAIARAMLSRAPLLVLDEATSALDSKSEKLITKALSELMKNRTTVVIAHRLSTIRRMDRILVMKKGQIVEDGDHQSLLQKKGEYAELWSHQSGGFIED